MFSLSGHLQASQKEVLSPAGCCHQCQCPFFYKTSSAPSLAEVKSSLNSDLLAFLVLEATLQCCAMREASSLFSFAFCSQQKLLYAFLCSGFLPAFPSYQAGSGFSSNGSQCSLPMPLSVHVSKQLFSMGTISGRL